MAENIVQGLFGLYPDQYRAQVNQGVDNEATRFAKMSPEERGAYMLYKGAHGLARTGAGMLGMVDPAEQRIQQTQQIMSQGGDLNTPEGLMAKAEQFRQTGDVRTAFQLVQLAKQQQAQAAEAAYKTAQAQRLGTQQMLDMANAQKALRDNPNLAITEVGVKGKPGWMQKVIYDKTGKDEPTPVGESYQTPQAMRISVGGGESKQPLAYVNDKGQVVWGTMAEARGRQAGAYSPEVKGEIAGKTEEGKEKAKRAMNMAGLGEVIEEANALLTGATGKPLPTGSGIGTAVDVAAGVFGMSPQGAEEAQRLKSIGGALTSKMPRMEGPQSDKDTQLYKEMAGVVGDSTIPRERRIAALNTVKTIWGKYADQNIAKPSGVGGDLAAAAAAELARRRGGK